MNTIKWRKTINFGKRGEVREMNVRTIRLNEEGNHRMQNYRKRREVWREEHRMIEGLRGVDCILDDRRREIGKGDMSEDKSRKEKTTEKSAVE
jgi:hypothetical protein